MKVVTVLSVLGLLVTIGVSDFLKIIRSNLSVQDSSRLLSLLNVKSNDCVDTNEKSHVEIRELLCKLYKALNGRDIHDDPDIMYDLIYENDKNNRDNSIYKHNAIYFNVREMPDVEKYNSFKVETDSLVKKGLIKLQTDYFAKHYIDNWD